MIESLFYDIADRATNKYVNTYELFKKMTTQVNEKVLDEKRNLVGITFEIGEVKVEITNKLREKITSGQIGTYNLMLKGKKGEVEKFVRELKDYEYSLLCTERERE